MLCSFTPSQAQQTKAKVGLMEANEDGTIRSNTSFAFRPIHLEILSKKEVCEKSFQLAGTILIQYTPLNSSSNTSTNSSSLPLGSVKYGFPLTTLKDNVLLFENDVTTMSIAADNEFKIEVSIIELDHRQCGTKSDVVNFHPSIQLSSLKLIINTKQEKVWLQKSDGSKETLIGKMEETLTVTAGAITKNKDVLQGKLTFKVFMKQ